MPASVSIITSCKGRLHHLRETLPSMLAQDYAGEWEIVVVDYDCPDGAFDFVRSLNNPRVRCIRVNDTIAAWSMSHARNVGAVFANGQILAYLDADNHPAPEYITTGVAALMESGETLCVPSDSYGQIFGACLTHASTFHALRGNDETLKGYGWDDIDFYLRYGAMCRTSYNVDPRCRIDSALIRAIPHDDAARTRFCGPATVADSVDSNRLLCADSSRAVNIGGYGRTLDYVTFGPIYPPALRELRRRNPWPAVQPNLPHNDHGWFGDGNKRAMRALLAKTKPRCVLEVGSWLGLSARFVLDHSAAHVACVDLWDDVAVDTGMLSVAGLDASRTLWDQFVANNWQHRERLTPIRTTTVAGIQRAREVGLLPDLVYIDASHERVDFEADLAAAVQCFPAARLCGDDWNWGGPTNHTIQPAVTALANARGLPVVVDGEFWQIG